MVRCEKGDLVKIIDNVGDHRFPIGTIVKIMEVREGASYKASDGEDFWWVSDCELKNLKDIDWEKPIRDWLL